jgi:virginiamycin B lyase
MQLYPLPSHSGHSSPNYIASGPDNNMWFTELDGSRVGRITKDGHIDGFPTPTASSKPIALVSHGGRVWFTEQSGHVHADIDMAGNIRSIRSRDPTPSRVASPSTGRVQSGSAMSGRT